MHNFIDKQLVKWNKNEVIFLGHIRHSIIVEIKGCAGFERRFEKIGQWCYGESELREKLRPLRARWDGERKLWYVRYGKIKGTPLEERLAELYG